MRVLVLYAHPVETSFGSAVHRTLVKTLRKGGHEVDDCDLNSEGFDPVMTRQERLDYHDLKHNRAGVGPYGPAAERRAYRGDCQEIFFYFEKMNINERSRR